MRTSLALFSVTLALGTAVEASPLNFAALFARNNDAKTESGSDHGVQLVSQKEGKCVSPADERVSESTAVTLVDCDRASAWQIDERSGAITLVDNPELALDAGRDISRGSKLSLYEQNGSESQTFKINEDGTVSVGRDQCLDVGNELQIYTCDSRNENQQFEARPVEKRGDDQKKKVDQGKGREQEQDKGREDAGEDKKQDDNRGEQDNKGQEEYGKETKPVEAQTVTATEYKTQIDHQVETVKETATEVRTKTEQAVETKVQNNTKVVTQTETEQVHQTVPTTVYKTETPKVETKYVTETQKPITVTETPKPVTVIETPKPVTVTETPKPVTVTETPKASTKVEYKTEYKTVEKPTTKYETVYATKTVEKEVKPTKDAGRQDEGQQKDQKDQHDQHHEQQGYEYDQGKEGDQRH